MAGVDALLTGVPRSGTTLACALLNRLPDTVALNEPMLVGEFPHNGPATAWRRRIRCFCREQRRTLRGDGTALARTADDGIEDNTFGAVKDARGLRASLLTRKPIVVAKPLPAAFTLVLKHPNAFTAMLGGLAGEFRCAALVRDPLAVLASWNTLPLALRDGHAPAAEALDPRLAASLARCSDRLQRQLRLLSWYFEVYQQHLPPERILCYEALVASGGRALATIVPSAARLSVPLSNRNASALYDSERMEVLREGLWASGGAYWDFYDRAAYA